MLDDPPAVAHNRPVQSRSSRLLSGPFWFALPVFAWLTWRLDFLVDDAFISYRYGRHLAQGWGLVWNPGESPPVEGFSNFLWTMLCAALERASLDPQVWTRAVGITCGALIVAAVGRLVLERAPRQVGSARLAALLAAALPPLAMWSSGGLETAAFSLAVFATFERLCIQRERPHIAGAALAAVFAVLLRADGFVWVGMVLVALVSGAPSEQRRVMLRAAAWVGAATAVATLGYLAFRWNYFDALEPNTARIKVAFGAQYLLRGAQYVASLLLCIVAIPVVLVGGLARLSRDKSGLARPSAMFLASAFAYLVVLGGDWMMMYRMAVPTMPFVAVLAGAWFATMKTNLTRVPVGATCAVLALLPAFDVHPVPQALRERAHFRWSQEFRSEYAMWEKGVVDIREWIEIGRALELHTLPGESMVIGNIGAFGYFASELVVYDTQGLTNREPLLPLDPKKREMPGHDRKVEIASFEKYAPTYLTARIVDALDPWQILPKDWQDRGPDGAVLGPNEKGRAKYEFELRPLQPEQGFRPQTALLLIRFRR